MSIRLMSRVWEVEGLSAGEKLVLLALADHANDDGYCWPSIARLSVKCSLTDRGVRKCITELEARGYIERSAGGGRGKTTHYIVRSEPHQPSLFAPVNPEPCSAFADDKLGTEFRNPERNDTETRNSVPMNHNRTITEPSGEARKRATRLPEDWKLPQTWGQWAMAEHGLSRAEVILQAQLFSNYWIAKSGKDATKLNWELTWRNWIIKAAAERGRPQSRPSFGRQEIDRFDGDAELAAIHARIQRENAGG